MTPLFDTHAHLDEIEDVDAVIEHARETGVAGIVAVGTDMVSNEKTLRIAERWPGVVYPAVGVHPCHLASLDAASVEREMRFVEECVVSACAVGEVGLDYHKRTLADVSKEAQKEAFSRLLAVAGSAGRPVLVHSRYAWTDALQLVQESGVADVVFHWFTGFSSVLHAIIGAGFYISATPAAEYHEEHRRAVRAVPGRQLLLETDSPVWYGRGVRYESRPSDVVRSLKAAAELRSEAEDDLAEATTRAAERLLGGAASRATEEVT